MEYCKSIPHHLFWGYTLKVSFGFLLPLLLYTRRQKATSKLCNNCSSKVIMAVIEDIYLCPCTEVPSSKTLINQSWLRPDQGSQFPETQFRFILFFFSMQGKKKKKALKKEKASYIHLGLLCTLGKFSSYHKSASVLCPDGSSLSSLARGL